jgi:hypothetical protein
MASYAQFMGQRVTVQYRAGDILLSATGTFAADSGRSIFLEQHVEQRGKRSYFRWEIPYPYIHHIGEEATPDREISPGQPASSDQPAGKASAASAGVSSSDASSLLSLPQRPKTA